MTLTQSSTRQAAATLVTLKLADGTRLILLVEGEKVTVKDIKGSPVFGLSYTVGQLVIDTFHETVNELYRVAGKLQSTSSGAPTGKFDVSVGEFIEFSIVRITRKGERELERIARAHVLARIRLSNDQWRFNLDLTNENKVVIVYYEGSTGSRKLADATIVKVSKGQPGLRPV